MNRLRIVHKKVNGGHNHGGANDARRYNCHKFNAQQRRYSEYDRTAANSYRNFSCLFRVEYANEKREKQLPKKRQYWLFMIS